MSIVQFFEFGRIGDDDQFHDRHQGFFGIDIDAHALPFANGDHVDGVFLTQIEFQQVFAHPLGRDGQFHHRHVVVELDEIDEA